MSNFILNLPIFFAGLIFISSFQKTSSKELAYGSNILGAGLGGLLEAVSYIIGIKALLGFVVVAYVGSYLVKVRKGV